MMCEAQDPLEIYTHGVVRHIPTPLQHDTDSL